MNSPLWGRPLTGDKGQSSIQCHETLNHVDLRNKGFVNLEGDFHSEEAPGQTHTSASLHLQYHATLMSVNLSRPGRIAKCLWYGKKEESILIIIFMSVHIIHLPLMGCLLSSSTFLGDGLALTPLTLMTEVTD